MDIDTEMTFELCLRMIFVRVRIIGKYIKLKDTRSLSKLLNRYMRQKSTKYADTWFMMDLYVTLGLLNLAEDELNRVKSKAQKDVMKENLWKKRLERGSCGLCLGTLNELPNDCLYVIAQKLNCE